MSAYAAVWWGVLFLLLGVTARAGLFAFGEWIEWRGAFEAKWERLTSLGGLIADLVILGGLALGCATPIISARRGFIFNATVCQVGALVVALLNTRMIPGLSERFGREIEVPLSIVGWLFAVVLLATWLVYVHRLGRHLGNLALGRSVVPLGWYLGGAVLVLLVFHAVVMLVPMEANLKVWDRSYYELRDILVALGVGWILLLLVRLALTLAALPTPASRATSTTTG